MGALVRTIRRLRRRDDGSIVTELALVLPIFLILLSGTLEVGFFLLLNLKVQHSVVTLADLVSRDEKISEDTIEDIFIAIPQIMTPYYSEDKSRLYITSVSRDADEEAEVFWQRSSGGLQSALSEVGSEGEEPNLPSDISVEEGETVIVTEYHYAYAPLVFDMFEPRVFVRKAYFKPRLGSLQEVED